MAASFASESPDSLTESASDSLALSTRGILGSDAPRAGLEAGRWIEEEASGWPDLDGACLDEYLPGRYGLLAGEELAWRDRRRSW